MQQLSLQMRRAGPSDTVPLSVLFQSSRTRCSREQGCDESESRRNRDVTMCTCQSRMRLYTGHLLSDRRTTLVLLGPTGCRRRLCVSLSGPASFRETPRDQFFRLAHAVPENVHLQSLRQSLSWRLLSLRWHPSRNKASMLPCLLRRQ